MSAKSVDTFFLHRTISERWSPPYTWQLESQSPSYTRQLESQYPSYTRQLESQYPSYPAAGEPVSLIPGSWRASIPHIRQLESQYPSYPAAGEPVSLIYPLGPTIGSYRWALPLGPTVGTPMVGNWFEVYNFCCRGGRLQRRHVRRCWKPWTKSGSHLVSICG